MTDEQLTADELATLAALLARLGPQAVAVTAQEAKQAAAKADYDEAIAERDARLAASPEFAAQVRESKRRADDEHKREVARLRAMAKLTSPPDPRAPINVPAGMTMLGGPTANYNCAECHQQIWGLVTLDGIRSLCEPCVARRLLRCDQCGAHSDDVVPTQYCSDGWWRCADCLTHIEPRPRRVAVAALRV